MKILTRSLAAVFVLTMAACSAPAPTDPTAAVPGTLSRDDIPPPPHDTTARGPNAFGSGN